MPDWRPSLAARLASLRLDPARERDVVDELSQHLDDTYHERRAAGASHQEAMRMALDEIEDHGLLAREMRPLKQSSVPPRPQPGAPAGHVVADVWQDLRYAARTLAHTPGWTAVVILLLALGIGANTALFSATDALLIASLPVRNPGELVRFRWAGANDMATEINGYGFSHKTADGQRVSASFSYALVQQFTRDTGAKVELCAAAPIDQVRVAVDGQAELAQGFLASGAFFNVLGVSARAGRLFGPDDDRATVPPVAVISSRYWLSRFGADPAVVGKVVKANDVPVTIVGVMPPSFTGIQQTLDEPPDIVFPLTLDLQIKGSTGPAAPSLLSQPAAWWLELLGRVRPGTTAEQLQSSLEGTFQRTARADLAESLKRATDEERAQFARISANAMPRLLVDSARRGVYDVDDNAKVSATILDAVVVAILLIICANVANLMLSRTIGRQREIAVRLSLGATRNRLARQLFTEALLLAGVGAGLGLLVAYWGVRLLPPPASRASVFQPRILAFTALATILTTIVFGAAPALRATRVDVNTGLKEASRGVAGRSRILARALLVVQVALSLALLVGAGLFLRTLGNLRRVDVGFDTRNLLLVRVTPRLSGYDQRQATEIYRTLLERFSTLPGVSGAALSQPVLITGNVSSTSIFVQGRTYTPRELQGDGNEINRLIISPGFFHVMGLPILTGRALAGRDDRAAPRVAVINETAVRTYFRGANPVGQHFGTNPNRPSDIEIVGVVRDAKYTDLREAAPPTMYMSYLQEPRATTTFALRTDGAPAAVAAAVRDAVHQLDSNLPIVKISTQAAEIERGLAQERLFAQAYAVFGGVALLLASVGLFGLMSYNVARRTAEMGIRMALGAQRIDVLRMVMRESLLLVAAGVVAGLAMAFTAGRLFATLLYGLAPHDPPTLVTAIAVMVLVSVLAAYLPARRASRIDPIVALRYE